MARTWNLDGPEQDRLSFDEAAKLFGYEPGTFRNLVREGKFPPPRGFGQNAYYSGLDVAVMQEMAGRWMPQPSPPPRKRKGAGGEDEEADETA